MVDGTISASVFADELHAFVELSATLKDTWQLAMANDSKCGYISKRQLLKLDQHLADVSSGMVESSLEVDELTEQEVEDEESNTIQVKPQTRVISCEYHVAYSDSYSVPVLYFNMYHDSGKLLTLDEIWSLVPQIYQSRLSQERWTFLTQQEHPILGRPYFQLHPCHTASLMKHSVLSRATKPEISTDIAQGLAGVSATSHTPSMRRKGSYLVQWLSSVAPVVRLGMSLEYGLIGNN